MKRFCLLFLIFLMAVAAVAGENVENAKTPVDLIINATDLGDILEIHVILPADAQGTVNYTINDENYEISVENGDAKLNISGLAAGDYVLKANYSGDDSYESIENQTTVTVSGIENATEENATDDNRTSGVNDTVIENDTSDNNITPVVNDTADKNSTPVQNVTSTQNNTTVAVANNQTQNMTPVRSNESVDNIETAVNHSPKHPKKVQNNNSLKLDAKTGLPILLVIIAAAILIIVRKYNF